MKLPVIRVLAVSGMYLQRRLESVCRQLAKQPGRFGGKHEIIDGYLLRAQKYNGRVVGTLMDFPSYLWFANSYRVQPSDPRVVTEGLLAPVVTGRDFFDPTVQVIVDPSDITIGFSEVGFRIDPISEDAGSGNYPDLYYRLFETNYCIHSSVRYFPNSGWWNFPISAAAVRVSCHIPPMSVERVNFLEDTLYWEETDDLRGAALREDNAYTPFTLYFRESVIEGETGHLLFTRSGDEDPDSFSTNRYSNLRLWSTHLPLKVEDDGSAVEFVVCFSSFVQASGYDSIGIACQDIAYIRVEFGPSEEEGQVPFTVSYVMPFSFNPGDSPNPAERPLVETHSDEGDYHAFNYQAPTYMSRTGEKISCAVRYAAFNAPDEDSTKYWRYTMFIAQFDPSVGNVVRFPVLTPDMSDESEGEDIEWWYWAAIGMDSDGETAVYVAMFNWLLTEDPVSWDVGLGVIVVEDGDAFALRVENPGCYAFPGRLNASVHLNNPDCGDTGFSYRSLGMMNDGVTYIGNGKFVFPVSLTIPTEVRESSRWVNGPLHADPREFKSEATMDFTVAQYELGSSGITILSTVKENMMYGFADSKIGRITVVQEEVADEDTGDITQPAVLIASYGDPTAWSFGVIPHAGETFISYDSGQTWVLLADTGSGCGVYYVGSIVSGFRDGHNLEPREGNDE